MLCVRCSHPLPPGADRCLRCFALNPRNREQATPPPPAAAETDPPSFFEPPFTAPELSAIGLGGPPAGPLRISIESDPPPPPLSMSIASDPPVHLEGSIDSEPPAEADGPFELAPPATSPNLPRIVRKPAPRERVWHKPTPPKGKPLQPPAIGPGLATPTLIFAMLPKSKEELAADLDLGDVELDSLEQSGPLPTFEKPETTLPFGTPPLTVPPDAHAAAVAAGTPSSTATPSASLDFDDAWRVVSNPPSAAEAPEPANPLSRDYDFGHTPHSAEPPSSLLATPLEVEPLAPPSLLRKRTPWAPAGARLLAWAIDAALLALCAALHVVVAVQVAGADRLAPIGFASLDYWLDLVAFAPSPLPRLWLGLAACLALAYSWLFAALGGRTPGMALTGLRLLRLGGAPVRPLAALARAALSLPSAALGLFGFALALFDARGQTLHDKLTGTAVVRDDAPLAQGPSGF